MIRARPSSFLQRVLRRRVCTTCSCRPPGSQDLSDRTPRPCEASCAVFGNVDAVRQIVAETAADPESDWAEQLIEAVCSRCHLSPTTGAGCQRRRDRTCPLVSYAGRVFDALGPLVLQESAAVQDG